jgi:hypothetical protein
LNYYKVTSHFASVNLLWLMRPCAFDMQARTLHAPTTVWAGEEDAAQMISKLPVVLRGKRPADLDADAAQLAGLLMTYPGAFKYRGLARNAPAAFLAVASEIQVGPADVGNSCSARLLLASMLYCSCKPVLRRALP